MNDYVSKLARYMGLKIQSGRLKAEGSEGTKL
jgi:hypothetical protein